MGNIYSTATGSSVVSSTCSFCSAGKYCIQVTPTILADRTGRLTPPTRLIHGTFGRLAPGAGDKDQSILPGLNQDRKDKRWDD